jgi:hypothetical protein
MICWKDQPFEAAMQCANLLSFAEKVTGTFKGSRKVTGTLGSISEAVIPGIIRRVYSAKDAADDEEVA